MLFKHATYFNFIANCLFYFFQSLFFSFSKICVLTDTHALSKFFGFSKIVIVLENLFCFQFFIITLRSISNIGARKWCKYEFLSTIIDYSTSAANGARDL